MEVTCKNCGIKINSEKDKYIIFGKYPCIDIYCSGFCLEAYNIEDDRDREYCNRIVNNATKNKNGTNKKTGDIYKEVNFT